jgi:hypothetical protein
MGGRRACLAFAVVAVAVGVAAPGAPARPSQAPTLGPTGIANVRFGLSKREAVAGLTRLFGAPSARGVNPGCGARYTEVEWGGLAAEFRLGTFSGFRYLEGGLPPTAYGAQVPPVKRVSPSPATSKGVALGSTLAQVRRAYGPLQRVGADMWRSSRGLVFVDDAQHDPVSPASRIVEIKIGTCGDF